MKRLSSYLNSMYIWAIVGLTFLAVVASYARNAFPVNFVVAVVTAAILDVLIKKLFLRKKFSFPFSVIISGIIVGSIVPFDASPLVATVGVVVAILSKYIIRLKGAHVFNPATFGLLVSLFVFSLGDAWWAAPIYNIAGYSITLAPLLILTNYKARKLGVAIPFLVTVALLSLVTGFIKIYSFTSVGIVSFLAVMPYYFGFIMVSEPRTSPYKTKEQIVFGIAVAILSFGLAFYNVKYALFIALLLGNLGYTLYRSYLSK